MGGDRRVLSGAKRVFQLARREARAGTYGYVGGNPTSFVDPTGLDIALVYNGPLAGKHQVALAISGRGDFSYGTVHNLGSSFTTCLGYGN